MNLKFQISCTCHCKYSVSETIGTEKIICPNCGTEYPHSAKLISILNTANDIPDGNIIGKEMSIAVISEVEDMKN